MSSDLLSKSLDELVSDRAKADRKKAAPPRQPKRDARGGGDGSANNVKARAKAAVGLDARRGGPRAGGGAPAQIRVVKSARAPPTARQEVRACVRWPCAVVGGHAVRWWRWRPWQQWRWLRRQAWRRWLVEVNPPAAGARPPEYACCNKAC